MTTTVTAITVASSNGTEIGGIFGLVLILTLVLFVVGKETAIGARGPKQARWNRALFVGLVPLAIASALVVAVNVSQAISS